MAKQTYELKIETAIAGIPAIIGVNNISYQKPWNGPLENCPSPEDYYGGFEFEATVLDRKGYQADWLAEKTDQDEIDAIVVGYLG